MKLRLPLLLASLLLALQSSYAAPITSPVTGTETATEEQELDVLRIGNSTTDGHLTVDLGDNDLVLQINNNFYVDSSSNGSSSLTLESGILQINATGSNTVWIGGETNLSNARSASVIVNGGILNCLNTTMNLSRWGQKATMDINGGEVNLLGLGYRGRESPPIVTLNGGRLNLGASGITDYADGGEDGVSGKYTFYFLSGTMGALANWTQTLSFAKNFLFSFGDGDGDVTFDTANPTSGTEHTLTLNSDTEGTGSGTIFVVGGGKLQLNSAVHTFSKDVTIQDGVLRWGNFTNSDYVNMSLGLGTGQINLESQGQLNLKLNGQRDAYTTITSAINMTGGSKIYIEDGSYILESLQVQTTGSQEAVIQSQYAKRIRLESLTGSGNLVFMGRTSDPNYYAYYLYLDEENNSFMGNLTLRGVDGNDLEQHLELTKDTSATNITVSLDSSGGGDLRLNINTGNATIAGLNGIGSTNLIQSVGGVRTLTVNGGGDYQGVLGANLNLVKTGAGTLSLNGTSPDFNQNITAGGGILDVSSATFTTVNYILDGGTLKGLDLDTGHHLSTTGAVNSLLDTLTLNGGTLLFTTDPGDVFANPSHYTVATSLVFGASATVFHFISDGVLEEGTYNLVTVTSGINSTYYDGSNKLLSNLYSLTGLATEGTRYSADLVVSGNEIQLNVVGSAANLAWNTAGDGDWNLVNTGTEYWLAEGGPVGGNYFYNGDVVTFGDVTGADGNTHNIIIGATVLPFVITVNAENQDYVFQSDNPGDSDIKISGTTKLEKSGNGALTISLTNDFSGGTDITGGLVSATAAGALGTGAVTLSDASLEFASGVLSEVSAISANNAVLTWLAGNTDDISSRLTVAGDSALVLNTGGNDVSFDTAMTGTGIDVTKTGSGNLTVSKEGTFRGTLTIEEGDVTLTGGGGNGRIFGTITIKEGGTLFTSGDSFGYSDTVNRVSSLTIEEGGTWTQTASNNTMRNFALIMNGGTIDGPGRIDFFGSGGNLVTGSGTENTISVGEVALRQDNTSFNIGENSTLSVSGVLRNATDAVEANLVKDGSGLMILTGVNTYKGTTTINTGTLQIGDGGATGKLGIGMATVNAGSTLEFNRNNEYSIETILAGNGIVNFRGGLSSEYILAEANTLSGEINIYGGTVKLDDVSSLGEGTTVTVYSGGTLDYNGIAGAGNITINAGNGSSLAGVNSLTHVLNITGNASVTALEGIRIASINVSNGGTLGLSGDLVTSGSLVLNGLNTVTVTSGNMSVESLSIRDESSRMTVSGDIDVTSGGDFRLGLTNQFADGSNALVQGGGNVSVNGLFTLNLDVNIGPGSHTYYLFGAGESGTYSSINADLVFSPDSEYLAPFFILDTSRFDSNGQVTINRTEWTADLYNQQDLASLGGTYTPSEANAYLGAKQYVRDNDPATRTDPVIFNVDYNVIDDAYKLSNGLGWMNFQTLITGDDNQLLIAGQYSEDTTPSVPGVDHGVIISNNNNDFGAGAVILGAHVVLDGSVAAGGQSLWPGEQNNLLGTGKVDIGGDTAILELRPGGGGDRGEHVMANEIVLHDGATLLQTSGDNILSGNLYAAGTGGTIANDSPSVLTLAGNLAGSIGARLTFQGSGTIMLDAIIGSLDQVALGGGSRVLLDNGSVFTPGSLAMEGNSQMTVTGGSELVLNSIQSNAAENDAVIILSGGILTANGNFTFNASNSIRLRIEDSLARALSVDAYNTLNVTGGSQVTINGLTSADGSFTKIGEGLLVLSGDFASYAGTATVGEGRMNMNASQYGGSLVAGVDGTETFLAIAAGSTVGGSLIANGNATVTLGNGASVNGGLAIDNATFTAGNDVTIGGSLLTIGENSRVTFGRDTHIASNAPGLEVGSGSSLRFGRGSSVTGTLANGVTIGGGATFSGFLDAGFNDFTLSSGSVFLLTQDDLNQYGGSTVGVSSRRTITVEEGAVFQLDSGLNFTTIPVWPEGVITILAGEGNGTVTIGGSTVVENADYSQYLGDTDYMWYFFNLIGGDNSLFLEIRANVEFDTLAETANEKAIADTASDIAMSASRLEGEIRDLGGALAMSTTANAHYNLSQLALSTSGVMAGFTAQMENLRRHTFDILNRAVQEKPGVERLSYEQHHNTVWANGLGGSYKLKGDGNAVGNTTNVWGGTVGASTGVTENLVVGLALTYTNSDTRLDRAMGKTEADAYYVDLFGRYRKDNWTVTGVVTGGWTSLDIERDLSLEGYSSHSKSKPNGKQVMGLVQVGYEFTVSRDQNSKLEPFVLVSGGYSEIDSLNEKGAGTAGLNVESQSQGLCTVGGGVRFIREYITDRDLASRGRFEARAMVLQDLTDLKPEVKGHFQGRPESRFQLEGAAPGKTAFVIGAGVVQPIGAHVSLFADVDGEFRRDENGVRGTVGVKYRF